MSLSSYLNLPATAFHVYDLLNLTIQYISMGWIATSDFYPSDIQVRALRMIFVRDARHSAFNSMCFLIADNLHTEEYIARVPSYAVRGL